MSNLKHNCGIFGITNNHDAAKITCYALHSLQHRGEEAAGIATINNNIFSLYKNIGLVQDVFNDNILSSLNGSSAIGHVRYSTTGKSNLKNAQPFVSNDFAICHNGNLSNFTEIVDELNSLGIDNITSDTEALLHLIQLSEKEIIEDKIIDALSKISGAYCLLILTRNKLIAVRDPYGVRPLCLGKLDNSFVISSETTAFSLIGAEFIRDISAGEMLIIDKDIKSIFYQEETIKQHCVFEHIYFARPDSKIDNYDIYSIRKAMGRQLAKECPADVDIIVPVLDSGLPCAMGYSEATNIPIELGLIRSHYIGRTFIQSSQNIRDLSLKLKLSPNKSVLKGKRIALIDDSIVRGTTSAAIVNLIKEAGATEVHLRIASPPVKHPCYYGIDIPDRKELIANNLSMEELNNFIGSNSLKYISLEGMLSVFKEIDRESFCSACFTGEYLVPLRRK